MKIVLSSVPYSNPLSVKGETLMILNPIALGYLAAAVKSNKATENDDIVILEKESLLHTLKTLAKDIVREQPDVLGISTYIWNYQRVLALCELVKEENPDILIVLGGPQITYTAETTLQENLSVDIAVRGEGEVTFCELLETLKTGSSLNSVRGISFRQNGQVVHTPERLPLQDLDGVPSPYLSGFIDLTLSERLDMFTARGCPYKCAYCVWHRFHKKIAYHSMERVLEELHFAYTRGIKRVTFWDSVFDSPKRARILCDYIAKEGFDFHMLLYQNPWTINPEQLNMLEKTGNFVVVIGVQSLHAEALRISNRPSDVDQIKKALQYLRESGLPSVVDIILGLPGETLETYKKGIDYITSQGFALSTNVLHLLPGSELFEHAQTYSIRCQPYPPYLVYGTCTMSSQDIVKGFKYSFYVENREKYRRIILGKEKPRKHLRRECDPLFGR
jgi:radical SAM superfamily enzyme YgiQ (UPF0313 family)